MNTEIELEGQHKHFGARVLNFEKIPIWYLQWIRVRTYALLYWKNRRFKDGMKFLRAYFKEGLMLFKELIVSPIRGS